MEQRSVEAQLVGGEQLQQAVLQAAMPSDEAAGKVALQNEVKKPFTKGGKPGPGRPKGSVPKVVKTVREAVMEAFDRVGGADYLVRLAEGTQSDRAAFTSLLNKVLPTQINQQVEGGIRLELSWLGQRNIGGSGTAAAQPAEVVEEKPRKIIDLEVDDKGKYRIADPLAGEKGQEPGG